MSIARINQNVMAMSSYRNLSVAQNALNNNVRHFSTGLRIEGAKDDATGLAISERFRSQITGYETANKNAQDANNLLQTADGALNETHSMLQRLRQLSITSANEATTQADRTNIQTEVNQLLDEIDNISRTTQYNGRNLLNGDLQGSKASVDAEANVSQNQYVSVPTVQGSSGSNLVDVSTVTNTAISTYAGQNVTFEIKLVASGASIVAQVYANGQLNTDGTFKSVADVSTVDLNVSSGTAVIQLSQFGGTGTLTLDLAQATNADIGKTAYVTLVNQQASISTDKGLSFQVRANQGQSVGVALDDMSTSGLRIQRLDVSDRLGGQNGIKMLDDAIDKLSTQRAKIGALQNRISSTISANELNVINQRSAESRIRDVDFAEETLSFTRNNILIQSGTAVLAQANAAPQSVLSLLR